MVTIAIADGRIELAVQRWDQLWSLRSHLTIPLDHVKSARIDPNAAAGWWHGLRLGGTNIPGLLTAGTFYSADDGLVFFDVHDPSRTVVLELEHEHYRRLVVEVEDPVAALHQLKAAGVVVG